MSRKVGTQEPLAIGELDMIEFDYSGNFSEDSVYGIASVAVTITVARGDDPAPEGLEADAPTISGKSAFIPVQGSVRNVTYLVECLATTDEPVPRALAAACYLPVVKLGQS